MALKPADDLSHRFEAVGPMLAACPSGLKDKVEVSFDFSVS